MEGFRGDGESPRQPKQTPQHHLTRIMAAVHSVHFYDNHDSLVDRLCGIVSSGLLVGNSVVLVCTDEHREQLIRSLGRSQIDVRNHARQGRFAIYDATEMLDMFMVGETPDADLFKRSVGKVLTEAKKVARRKDRNLTVFGEMVALLWEDGKKTAALALEKLWNRTLEEKAFHLHCAYPAWLFDRREEEMHDICQLHSHFLEDAPGYLRAS